MEVYSRSDDGPLGTRSLSFGTLIGGGCWRTYWDGEAIRSEEVRKQNRELKESREIAWRPGPSMSMTRLRGSVEPLSIRAVESTPRGGGRRARRVRGLARAAARCRASRSPCRNRRCRSADEALSISWTRRAEKRVRGDRTSGRGTHCIVAVKEEPGEPGGRATLLVDAGRCVRDGLRIECGCRPDLPRGPRLGTSPEAGRSRTFVVNLPKQDVAHAENCVFRVERPPLPPIVHSDVFKLISRADADRSRHRSGLPRQQEEPGSVAGPAAPDDARTFCGR